VVRECYHAPAVCVNVPDNTGRYGLFAGRFSARATVHVLRNLPLY